MYMYMCTCIALLWHMCTCVLDLYMLVHVHLLSRLYMYLTTCMYMYIVTCALDWYMYVSTTF